MTSVDTLLVQLRYTNRTRVKADIDKLSKEYKTLIPRAVDYVHDNGAQSRLLVLSGTVPIFYNSVQYNIPVDLFLMIAYPAEPPKLYVRPTPNMTVKANHRHVSPDGLCYLPYLAEWNVNHSNLNGLVEIASSVFSIEPPLFTKPPGATAVSPVNASVHPAVSSTAAAQRPPAVQPALAYNPNAYSANAYNNTSNGNLSTYETYASPGAYSSGTYSPAVATPTAAAATAASSAYTSANADAMYIGTISSTKENDAEKKALLIDQVSMRMYEEIDRKQRKLRDELDAEMALSLTLSTSHDNAIRTLRDLKACSAQYGEALTTLNKKSEELDLWNADSKNHPVLTAEQRVLPFDALSSQIVRLHSEINAIDDAFYHLERALVSSKNQTVDLNTFLKECRQLARKQFLSKVHLKKIHAECLQQEAEHAMTHAHGASHATQPPHSSQPPHPLQPTQYAQYQHQQQAQFTQQQQQLHAQPAAASAYPPHHISSGPPLVPRAAVGANVSTGNNGAYPQYDGVSAVPYPGANTGRF